MKNNDDEGDRRLFRMGTISTRSDPALLREIREARARLEEELDTRVRTSSDA